MFPSPRPMKISFSHVRWALVVAAFLGVALLALHWLPGRQVRLHQEHFLRAVENRQWPAIGAMMAADYKDRWGQNKATVLARLPQVFADFLACGIVADDSTIEWPDHTAVVRSRLHFVGSGGPIAQFLINETAALKQPFAFTWRRQSWKPWDWQLVRVDQPELDVPADADFQP